MAILTTIVLVTAGVTLVGGGLNWLLTRDDVEKQQIQAKINELQTAIGSLNATISIFNSLKSNANESIDYLNSGMNDFTNGGHVMDGTPLAKPEFDDCLQKMTEAVNQVDSVLVDLNDTLAATNKELAAAKSKLAELSK